MSKIIGIKWVCTECQNWYIKIVPKGMTIIESHNYICCNDGYVMKKEMIYNEAKDV